MKSIAVLLEGLNISSDHAEVSGIISDYFLEKFGEEIVLEYKGGKIFLQISPVLRSEVFLRKKEISLEINGCLSHLKVKVSRII